jgi:guanosine-3',5'-bis(diphosphate) 3'-pyrophosphohydrolase
LNSGETVEIITAPSASPGPQWLEWVVSAKARTSIRHFLKRLQHEDAVEFGHRMLDRALDARGASLDSVPVKVLERFLADARYKRLEELLAEIALGNRMPDQVAAQLVPAPDDAQATLPRAAHRAETILISGAERGVLSFGNCCNPVPGDDIVGFLSAGKGIVVHRLDCPNIPEYRKQPERIVPIGWDREVSGDYRARLRIVVDNKPGVLATVATAIAERNSNIENVEYQERDPSTSTLMFTIEVRNRKHLAEVMRRVRNAAVVHGVYRFP